MNEAREGVVGEVIDGRTSVYGPVVDSFTRVAQLWSALLDHPIQPWQVPLLMMGLKMVRTMEAPDYSDNSDDIEGYLDIFRQILGDDMIKARSVVDYLTQKEAAHADYC